MGDLQFELTLRNASAGKSPERMVRINALAYRSRPAAFAIIYPAYQRSPEDILEKDDTIAHERFHAERWTDRFLAAAFQPPDFEHHEFKDHAMACWNALKRKLAEDVDDIHRPYRHDLIEARFALLFRIALGMHEGGHALYPTSGIYGAGGRYSRNLKFGDRLERIEKHLQEHKWLVMGVIEELLTYGFVATPDQWVTARTRRLRQPNSNVEGTESSSGKTIAEIANLRLFSDGAQSSEDKATAEEHPTTSSSPPQAIECTVERTSVGSVSNPIELESPIQPSPEPNQRSDRRPAATQPQSPRSRSDSVDSWYATSGEDERKK